MRRLLGLFLPLALAACAGEPAEERSAAEVRDSAEFATALATYTPTMFDTIEWKADTAQTNRGAVVWMFSCRKCHGDTGKGDGGFIMQGDTVPVQPPPLHTPGWRFATDREALLQYIYAGNRNGMPHWGVVGLGPRDIDAVAAYIQKLLVPPPPLPQS